MSDFTQLEFWRDFYELAWQQRLEFISDLIEGGERNPLRCLRLLDAMERRYSLIMDRSSKTISWVKQTVDPQKRLPSGCENVRTAAFMGKFITLPPYTYSNLSAFLVDFINEREAGFDAILELGSGIGKRVIELYYEGGPTGIPIFGGELTTSGVELARKLVALEPAIQAEFFNFDHTKPDLSTFKARGFKNVLVYTAHSLEQVNKVPLDFFRVVAGCAERVTCVHLEPFGFQISDASEASRRQCKFFSRHAWNVNLVALSDQAQSEGIIHREWASCDSFVSTDTINQTSLMVWRN